MTSSSGSRGSPASERFAQQGLEISINDPTGFSWWWFTKILNKLSLPMLVGTKHSFKPARGAETCQSENPGLAVILTRLQSFGKDALCPLTIKSRFKIFREAGIEAASIREYC